MQEIGMKNTVYCILAHHILYILTLRFIFVTVKICYHVFSSMMQITHFRTGVQKYSTPYIWSA